MNVGNDLASLGMITHNLQLNAEHADTQRASSRDFQQPCMLHSIDSVTVGKASGCIRTEQLMGMCMCIPSGVESFSPGRVGGGGGSAQASSFEPKTLSACMQKSSNT